MVSGGCAPGIREPAPVTMATSSSIRNIGGGLLDVEEEAMRRFIIDMEDLESWRCLLLLRSLAAATCRQHSERILRFSAR